MEDGKIHERKERLEVARVVHVVWQKPDEDVVSRGRVAVRRDGQHVRMVRVAGESLPVHLLGQVLDSVLGEDWRKEADQLHRTRRHPWRVVKRVGMSGAIDYLLQFCPDADMGIVRTVARIHISMRRKLNENLPLIWLGDLAPLLAIIEQDFPPFPDPFLVIHDVVSGGDLLEGFHAPGSPSGIVMPDSEDNELDLDDDENKDLVYV